MTGTVNKFFIGIAVAAIFLATPLLVMAARDYGTDATRGAAQLPSTVAGASSIPEVIGVLVKTVLSLVGIVFFGLIFYAGFGWMTAQGNSEKVDSAKKTIVEAALGLIIVLAAYAITNFVFENLAPPTPGSSGLSCSDAEVVPLTGCTNVDCSTFSSPGACVAGGCCEWK